MPALVGVPPSISVAVKLYITNSKADPEKCANEKSDTDSTEKSDGDTSPGAAQPTSVLDSSLVSVDKGRPDLQKIIQNEIANSSGRMSINGKLPQADFVGLTFLFLQLAAHMEWQTQCAKLPVRRAHWTFSEGAQLCLSILKLLDS